MKPLRFAVLGDPVAHSKSPAMQGAALRALGLPHTYEARRTTPAELAGVIQDLREGTFSGLNVTIPHKTRVLELVDAVDASALATGAANTLVRDDRGRIVAHNTDAPALQAELVALAALAADPSRLHGARALVLGSGGAARAASVACDRLGLDVVVRARTHPSGAGFELRPGFPARQAWAADPASEAATLVVVQATSAGMSGADPGGPVAAAVAWESLPPAAVALDVVYAPPSTPFLEAARRRGLRSTGGLGMLARQGALALELWLGVAAPLDVMLAAIRPLAPRT
jgi:shikimate dehydrogenase